MRRNNDEDTNRTLDDWISSYLNYTDNSEPPVLYREWVAVSCIAAALQRKCFLSWGELTFYPNMYVVLVGPPGKCRKGTAMNVGAKILREIGIDLAAEAITREALIRELKNQMVQEADVESGEMYYHASLTIYSQELMVFLGYNNLQLISDLTDWYDCRDRWTYRTKNMGTDEITGVWVNLIGAATPDLIRSSLPQDAVGGGLASRIIFVYEEEKGKTVAAPFLSQKDQELRQHLVNDLDHISSMEGGFQITEEFLEERWVPWYEKQDRKPRFRDKNFQGYNSRRPNHLLKLCMIMSASGRDDMSITVEIFDRAIDLLERTEKKMPRVFSGFGKASIAEVMSSLMAFIGNEKETTKEEVLKMFYQDLESSEQLMELLVTLQHMGFCEVKTSVDQNGVSKTVIKHNPNTDIEGFEDLES